MLIGCGLYCCPFNDRAKQRVMLVFEGIDTIASVSLNGAALGQTDNMFLQYVRRVNPHHPHHAVGSPRGGHSRGGCC